MASKIKILPDLLINRIAAGEVVERPASVVKELLENAVDAGATRILVEVLQSGKTQIRVTDNGRGMDREDLLLSLERHATSKIDHFSDLWALTTMGFRGEALPSIAAVSRLTLISIPRGEVSGWRLEVWGGERQGLEAVAGTSGTVVEVNDLFYHTPARLAFLKSPRAEWNQILLAFERVALGFPELELTLRHNGKTVFHLAPPGGRDLTLKALWGGERTTDLIPLEGEEQPVRVSGFISPPHIHAHTARHLAFIVNRRWVRSPLLYPLLLRSYEGLLPAGRYPLAALWLDIPPDLVDVNIHPAKQEVRFSQGDWVSRVVAGEIRQALKTITPAIAPFGSRGRPAGLAPDPEGPLLFREPASGYEPDRWASSKWREPSGRTNPRPGWVSTSPETEPKAEDGRDSGPFSRMAVIGQIHQTYILGLADDGLILLDQHAAHERILYERFLDRSRQGKAVSQGLLLPVLIELSPIPEETAAELADSLASVGLEIAPAGGRSFWLKSVPPELNPEQAVQAVQEISEIYPGRGGRNRSGGVSAIASPSDGLPWRGSGRTDPGGRGDPVSPSAARSDRKALPLPPRSAYLVPAVPGRDRKTVQTEITA